MSSPHRLPGIEEVIERLGLVPHPEGGYYRETFRSSREDASGRSASTAIYFMLPGGVFSAFHVIRSADEIWHHYDGEPVEIHTLSPNGAAAVTILGPRLDRGERPQVVVPAGT